MTQSWVFWALVSAAFAALTAIFGVIFLSEKLSLVHWFAVTMIASGAIMLAVF